MAPREASPSMPIKEGARPMKPRVFAHSKPSRPPVRLTLRPASHEGKPGRKPTGRYPKHDFQRRDVIVSLFRADLRNSGEVVDSKAFNRQ
jgi:hypothetical protein